MGMAQPDPILKWDEAHTREVKMMWIRYRGTSTSYDYFGAAPSVRVCKTCSSAKTICRCAWRLA